MGDFFYVMECFFLGADKFLLRHSTGSLSPFGCRCKRVNPVSWANASVYMLCRCLCRNSAKLGEDGHPFVEYFKAMKLGDVQLELEELAWTFSGAATQAKLETNWR